MNWNELLQPANVLHWNYRGFTEFPLSKIKGEEDDITDIYLKENLIAKIPQEIDRLTRLESLYLTCNDISEIPVEISRLKCLKCLDLSGNRLKYLPEVIGEVRSLKYLILDDNEITHLPLRLAELRGLRYLSLCDNKLRWLPQRPVYNYYHCELRFWRNTELKTIPYSLWYHMLRDQQTRSLNIGCLKIPEYQQTSKYGRCRLKLQSSSRTWEVDVESPYEVIQKRELNSPPTLLELCQRKFYEIVAATAKKKSNHIFSLYADFIADNNHNYEEPDSDPNNNFISENLEENFGNMEIKQNSNLRKATKDYFVPSDIIEEHFDYLPRFLKDIFVRGPISRCENVKCKKPIFDYVNYEFCIGKIVLIDNVEDIILSATFCSQYCANVWKGGKTNFIIPWTLIT